MALEAQVSHVKNSVTTKKFGKEPSEIPSFGPPSVTTPASVATPVGREDRLGEQVPIGGFNRTARRIPVTRSLGHVFFPVYKKATPVTINVLESSIRRDRNLDMSRSVVQKGKLTRTKNSRVTNTSLSLGSLTL